MNKLYVFSTLLLAYILIAASSGVAEIQNQDRTGSPDGANTCTQCHNSGNFDPVISLTVTDSGGNTTSTYMAGETYLLSYMVSETVGAANIFGFQSTALLSDLSNAGTFLNPGVNVQLEDVTNATLTNRHIVEHSTPSSTGVFQVEWIAPAVASGDVMFYYSGNSANGNSSPSGDQWAGGSLTLSAPSSDCLGDLNDDDEVTASDLTLFLAVFGSSCGG